MEQLYKVILGYEEDVDYFDIPVETFTKDEAFERGRQFLYSRHRDELVNWIGVIEWSDRPVMVVEGNCPRCPEFNQKYEKIISRMFHEDLLDTGRLGTN